MTTPALLALADGTLLHGESVGADGTTVGEMVFNTAMSGYQEILTDPSYSRQIVTFTSVHIGNVGVNPQDEESDAPRVSGVVVREHARCTSNWRATGDLGDYLRHHGVVAIGGVDTRRLTRLLRDGGAQGGCIAAGGALDERRALDAARAFPGMRGLDLAREVSTAQPYEWTSPPVAAGRRPLRVVAYDFGIKRAILGKLAERGCQLTVVPATTPAAEVLAHRPDGVFLSNGPGDPEPCDYAIAAIGELLEARVPLFGICLGHQLLALAAGARTVKMKFGHHGANHPVKSLATGAVFISSQNHGFAVDGDSLPAGVEATHVSLFDGSLQGIRLAGHPAFGFQGHPEASPGPHELDVLFDEFVGLMKGRDGSSARAAG